MSVAEEEIAFWLTSPAFFINLNLIPVFLEFFFLYSSFLSFQDLFLSHHWFQEFISQSLAHHLKESAMFSKLTTG